MKNTTQKRTVREKLSAQNWRRHITSCQASGTTQVAYCIKHGLSRYAFQYWKRRLKDERQARQFVEVAYSINPESTPIAILVNSRYQVQVSEGVKPEHLRAVLSVVTEL